MAAHLRDIIADGPVVAAAEDTDAAAVLPGSPAADLGTDADVADRAAGNPAVLGTIHLHARAPGSLNRKSFDSDVGRARLEMHGVVEGGNLDRRLGDGHGRQ